MKDEDKKFTLIEIREKVKGWKKEGYLVDELENILFQNQNIENKVQVPKKQKKSTGKILVAIVVIFFLTIAVTATVYVYVSGMIGTGGESTPTIAFSKTSDRITVSRADPGLDWDDFSVYVNSTTAETLSGTITAGDVIDAETPGYIKIVHTPTNSLIGTWTFS